MRLATPSGHVTVDLPRERAWPLAGVNYPERYGSGYGRLNLGKTSLGHLKTATYAEIYRTNPYVYAAVNSISRGVSRLPLKTYAFLPDGNRERVRSDLPQAPGRPTAGVALDRVVRKPEPGWSRSGWLQKMLLDRMIYGNSLASKDRSTGALTALWHLTWSLIEVQEGESVPILYYEYAGTKEPKRFIPEDVFHLGRGTDPGKPIGLSPLSAMSATVTLHHKLTAHLDAFFQNQARPSGMLEVQPGTKKEVLEAIREEVTKLYTAPESAGKVLITSGKFSPITTNAQQAEIIELLKLSREEVAIGFGLSPTDLGILDRAIMANVRENRERFIRDAIGYWASEFEDEFMAQVIEENPSWNGHFVEFDLGEFLRPDLEARAETYDKMRHVYTPNEMRAMENLKPLEVEGADTVWMAPGQAGLGVTPPEPETPAE